MRSKTEALGRTYFAIALHGLAFKVAYLDEILGAPEWFNHLSV